MYLTSLLSYSDTQCFVSRGRSNPAGVYPFSSHEVPVGPTVDQLFHRKCETRRQPTKSERVTICGI